MSRAKYHAGLVAGVPTGTVVAQKYGEAVYQTGPAAAPEITLSNCGVIYHPTHPYILCVMSEGQDPAALTNTIAAIASTTWNTVSQYALGQS